LTTESTTSTFQQQADAEATRKAFEQTADAVRETTQQNAETNRRSFEDVNARVLQTARHAGTVAVDSYANGIKGYAGLHERVGSLTRVKWVTDVTAAQAGFLRQFAEVTASVNRALLK